MATDMPLTDGPAGDTCALPPPPSPPVRSRSWFSLFSAVFLAALAAVGFCLLVSKIQDIIALFLTGFVIAYVLDPLIVRLQRRGWSRGRSVATIMLTVALLAAILAGVIVSQLVGQVQDVVTHWDKYSERADVAYQGVRQRVAEYADTNYPGNDIVPQMDAKVAEAQAWAGENVQVALKWVTERLVSSLSLVALGALLFVISFHFMMVIDAIRTVIVESMPEKQGESLQDISIKINAMLGQYVRGEAVACILVAIVATLLLGVVKIFWGTNYGLIVGVITGITYVIPYVGPAVSISLAGFFGYVTAGHDPLLACLVSAGFMVLTNQLFDVILTPKIVGGRIGLHPLAIMFSVFAGLKLMGVPGMIIATPLAASIKIALMRWLPIKGLEEGQPLPTHRPLAIDIGKAASIGFGWAKQVGQRLEHAGESLTHAIGNEGHQGKG